jgi:pimeloyl-ACP methyl ester carboxylesterase
MKKKIFLAIIMLLVLVAIIGPSPDTPIYKIEVPQVSHNLKSLSDSIVAAERQNPLVKLNNEARIIWADSAYRQTEWAMVYLHGYSASQMEGHPIHRDIAKYFGMNLFLARLSDHGLISDSALVDLTPDRLWESAKEALFIGKAIGKKVILMSTSTGGTLALALAAQYPNRVDGLINYSPNVRINNSFAGLMNNPWGLNILNLMSENGYVVTSGAKDSVISQYWNTRYRTEALPQLEELVETTMQTKMFELVQAPSLTLAYFKDEEHQDPTVKVSAMRWMHESLGTSENQKRYIELADVGVHPMASELRSQDLNSVRLQTKLFIEEVLGVQARVPASNY